MSRQNQRNRVNLGRLTLPIVAVKDRNQAIHLVGLSDHDPESPAEWVAGCRHDSGRGRNDRRSSSQPRRSISAAIAAGTGA